MLAQYDYLGTVQFLPHMISHVRYKIVHELYELDEPLDLKCRNNNKVKIIEHDVLEKYKIDPWMDLSVKHIYSGYSVTLN